MSDARLDALVAELRALPALEGAACAHAAMVVDENGRTHVGRTIRSGTPGLDACATRVALARRIAAGGMGSPALVVAVGAAEPPRLCGLCRQSLLELASDARVWVASAAGPPRAAGERLPRAFRPEHLEEDG